MLFSNRRRIFVRQDKKMYGDVCGVIGMTNGICGSCVVSFPLHMAEKLVSCILEEDVTGNMEMVNDGIGEVANMVAGGAKRRFDSSDYRFDISTPTVILGAGDLELYNPEGIIGICCEFEAHLNEGGDDDCFLIEVAVRPS